MILLVIFVLVEIDKKLKVDILGLFEQKLRLLGFGLRHFNTFYYIKYFTCVGYTKPAP